MARPIKTGLEYFPKDTDTFSDRKIRRLLNEFGSKGYTIFDYLLCLIYSGEGYYVKYDDELAFDVADFLGDGIKESLVKEVVSGCIRVGLFNATLFDASKILTSSGIQKRYTLAKRNGVIDEKMRVITAETPVIAAETPENGALSTQSKVKESKGKERESRAAEAEHTQEEISLFDGLQEWILKFAPQVSKMKEPFTIDQYLKLRKKYSKEQIGALILKMHNYKPLLKNNISAYLTFKNWAAKEFNNTAEPKKPEITDGYKDQRKLEEEKTRQLASE